MFSRKTTCNNKAESANPDYDDGKIYEVDEIIQELAELVRRKNFLRAKLDEIVSGKKAPGPHQLHNGKDPVPVKKEVPSAAVPSSIKFKDSSCLMAPKNDVQACSWPSNQSVSKSRVVTNASPLLDTSRHMEPAAGQTIQKGAMVMVVKQVAKQALVYTGVIVELDEDYVRLDRGQLSS